MSLFEASSHQFVNDTGRLSLHPVPDLNSATYCRVLCVVEKKKSRYFWRKTKYLPTPFVLNDLLVQTETESESKQTIDVASKIHKSVFITGYKNNPQFHVKGKLGAKIASEFDMDTDTSESFTVSMNIGNVMRNEVYWENLHDALIGKTINLDHKFMQRILANKRRSLCLIHEMLCTMANDTKLDKDTVIEADADIKSEANVSPIFAVNVSGSASDSHHRSYDIPKDTVLGYGCYNLLVNDETGEFDIECVRDVTDAPQVPAYHKFDEPDGQQDKALVAFFKAILESPSHDKFVDCFKKILIHPKSIEPLRTLLEDALHAVSYNKEGSTPFSQFKSKFDDNSSGWLELLHLLGFRVDEKADKISFPAEDTGSTLHCCTGFTEAVVELSEPQCEALRQVTTEYFEPLLYVLKNALYERPPVVADDPQIRGLWTHTSNPAKTLLLSLGFNMVTQDNKKVLKFQGDSSLSLEDVYVGVFGLCAE